MLTLCPSLDQAFLDLVRPFTAGDPMRLCVRWTNRSHRQLAADLAGRGFRVSTTVVQQLLDRHRLGRRTIQKTRAKSRHVDRNRQFEIIARLRAEYEASPNPIVSMDTKKKEFIGNLHRAGPVYADGPVEVLDHDFPAWADSLIYPHGLYDLKQRRRHINVGTSHDTSRFACDSLAYWWETHGRAAHPAATSILLLCDGGGSNSSRRYVFKHALEGLANRLGLEIRVAHDPPYTSKYNPIEHQFFCHVSRACRGVVFTSVADALTYLARTQTTTGLRTTIHLLDGDYPTGESAPKGYKEAMKLVFDDQLPAWNYRAIPTKPGS